MSRRPGIRIAVLLLVGVLASARPGDVQAQDVGMAIGTVPASAVVQDMQGAAVDLAATFVGRKPVVVEFWATWCPICEALLPRMEAAQRRYGAQVEFVVIGVGVNQSRSSMQRHLDRHPMPFRFYFDNAGAAVRAFQAPSTSYIVALDARGRVVYTGSGEDQDVEAAARRAAAAR